MTELTQEKLKELLDYNPDTGVFTLKGSLRKVSFLGVDNNYIRITLTSNRYILRKARAAWLYVYGSFPVGNVKYINGIETDNRLSNLRGAIRRDKYYGMTLAEKSKIKTENVPLPVAKERISMWERKKKNKDTGFFVTKYGTYRAQLFKDGKKVFDKTFKTKREAKAAYIAKKKELHSSSPL